MTVLGRTRLVAGVAAVVTVVGALGIRGVAGGDFGKYAGDALYTVLVHILVVFVSPGVRPRVAGAGAFAFSCGVELLQLTPVPAALSERSGVARLVLGSTFNAPDLLWYAVGAAAAGALHSLWVGRRPGRADRQGPRVLLDGARGRSPGP
jgi:hypothetical protein